MTRQLLRRALLGAALFATGTATAQDLTLVPPGDESSSFRSALGDVNRDGVQDYILSAIDGFTFEGGFGTADDASVLVYDGKTGDLIYNFEDPEPFDGFSRFGFSVAVGDVNGDWYADIAVGSPAAEGGAGAVYVYSGRTGERMMTLTSPSPRTDGVGGRFGSSVEIANVVGFFVPDIVVGATGEDVEGVSEAGRAHVFLGSYFSRYRGRLVATLDDPSPRQFGNFGFKIASADFNLDWRRDPVVSSQFEDNEFSPGEAYVFQGGFRALRHNRLLATIRPPDLEYDPTEVDQPPFGISELATGDFDGDWRPDLAVSVQDGGTDAASLGAGVVYVYTNPNAEAPALTLASPNSVPNPTDPFSGGSFGNSLAAADLDADGDAEIVVGAIFEDGQGGSGDGVVYILDGRDGSLLRQIDVPPSARPAPFRNFGFDVSAARDRAGTRLLVADAGSEEGYVYLNPLADDAARLDHEAVIAQAQADGVDPSTRLRLPAFTEADVASADAQAQDAAALGLDTALLSEAPLELTVAPNPSVGRAEVSFALDQATDARVAVYDALGREVAVLADGTLAAQTHTLSVQDLAPGVYVVRLDGASVSLASRLTVVR